MKRDMDLIRQIMLFCESEHSGTGTLFLKSNEEHFLDLGYDEAALNGHFEILANSGLADARMPADGGLMFNGFTWRGHDLLDSVRDPGVWDHTKAAAGKVGGFSVDILVEIAKAYIKKKAADVLGLGA